mgnify:FL=1
MAVHEINHPLIKHKMGIMRNIELSTKSFRELAQEITTLLTYEASKDFLLEDTDVQGWNGPVTVQ